MCRRGNDGRHCVYAGLPPLWAVRPCHNLFRMARANLPGRRVLEFLIIHVYSPQSTPDIHVVMYHIIYLYIHIRAATSENKRSGF